MKAVVSVLVLGSLLACLFLFVVGGGDTDNFQNLGSEAGSVVDEVRTSTQDNSSTESYGVIGETGLFFCETVRGGQWSKAIGACYLGD